MKYVLLFSALSLSAPFVNAGTAFKVVTGNVQHHLKANEKNKNIPDGLLSAIAYKESKQSPYAVNVHNRSYTFSTKEQAISFVKGLHNKGVRNFNLGCMQINWPAHAHKFKDIGDVLDLTTNIAFAAELLKSHYNRLGSWEKAVQHYNSAFPQYGVPYQQHVYTIWGKGSMSTTNSYHESTANRKDMNTKKKRPVLFTISGNTKRS